jgi:hypothetical protein
MRSLIIAIALIGASQADASVPTPAIFERCTVEQMRGNLIKGDDLMIIQGWRSGRDFVPFPCEG